MEQEIILNEEINESGDIIEIENDRNVAGNLAIGAGLVALTGLAVYGGVKLFGKAKEGITKLVDKHKRKYAACHDEFGEEVETEIIEE